MKKMNIILVFAFLLSSYMVTAQRRGQRGNSGQDRPSVDQIMSRLDQNNDNKIDKEEASAAPNGRLLEAFDSLDTDQDGYITREEFTNMRQGKRPEEPKIKLDAEKLIATLDQDGSGTIDELEVAIKENEVLKKHFTKIDVDSDGHLTKEELTNFGEKPKKKNQ